MSDSVRPHRRQPSRLPHPWDSPGKNTGVACHFLLQCLKVKSESEAAQSCPTLSDPMDRSPPGSSIHGIFQARVLEWVLPYKNCEFIHTFLPLIPTQYYRFHSSFLLFYICNYFLWQWETWSFITLNILIILSPLCSVSNLPSLQLPHHFSHCMGSVSLP